MRDSSSISSARKASRSSALTMPHSAPLSVHDRHAPDAAQAHAFDGGVDVVVLAGREQVVAHDVAHLQAERIEAEGDHGHDDVAVGDDADGNALAVRLVDHDQVADMVLAHEERRALHAFVARAADGVCGADLPTSMAASVIKQSR
jgi:hypothetical protein